MDTLDRFLVREFFFYFVLILLGWAFLFLGVDFLSKLWSYTLPLPRVLEIYLYKLPEALQQFVPIAALMATLLVLSTMSRQNEVLALYASGVSTFRILSTFVAIVATVSTVSFLMFDSLVPSFTKKQIMIRQGLDPSSEQLVFNVRSGLWYRSHGLIYNVGRFVPQKNLLEDVSVYRLTRDFRVTETIHARRARYRNNRWVLENGRIVRYPVSGDGFPQAETFSKLAGVIPEQPKDFKSLEIHERTMRLRDLRKFIQRNSDFGLDTTEQKVHYHERVALVFAPLIFILLGIPFALNPLKNYSTAKSIAFCFLIIFLYLLMFRMSLSVGKGGHIPPAVAAWSPNALFLALAIFFLGRRA